MLNQALGLAAPSNDLNSDGVVNLLDAQYVVDAALGYSCAADNASGGAPTISGFSPASGPVGTVVTVQGANFGAAPLGSMPALAGGAISLPLSTATANSAAFVIPAGAASGAITVSNGTAAASTSSAFTVTPANTFSLAVSPPAANLIQGQAVAYAVQLSSANSFSGLAQLSVSGVPAGVTASFTPSLVASGGTSILNLSAPAGQPLASANLTITASATVQSLAVTQSGAASLAVVAPTTSLIGRTVVSNPQETPLAGVTVTPLGTDGSGNTTNCSGFTTTSDAAGNFALTNLPQSCTGPQLFNFNGVTATSPAGQYAGVNLVFTLVLNQVTPSPVLVHLPRIDNVETFTVTQNAAADQTYAFRTIPGLAVTVYAHTTFTLPDGTVPQPTFPLAAVQVPVDRLPDAKPNVPTMVRVFIVAFQPAESTASQPVAVYFPNVSNTPPGTDMPLMTLDPTHGTMVPYGTGAVSADGTQIVPDSDPAHPGHRYGLLHFDWHGQMPAPANQSNPCPACAAAHAGDPVDLSSGLQVLNATDIFIAGERGPIAVQRVYRTLTTYNGAFGLGADLQYAWQLGTGAPNSASAINLIAPDGNRFLFSRQTNGTLTNSTMPTLQGAVMTTSANGSTTLRYRDGTVYAFQAFAGVSYLSSITDRNGNATTFTVAPLNASTLRITKITDPVGRSLTLAYNAATNVTSVTDPTGRTVTYTYNPAGTLATVTDPLGDVTTYQYDSQNRMSGMLDPRGVQMFQNTFDSNGRVIQQLRPDGGVFQFSYLTANSLAATSPVIQTTVTDPLSNQTQFRFNIQGLLTDVTDALGQTRSFTLSPGTNLVTLVTGSAQCDVCGPPGQGDVRYTYDASGNVLTSTDALGNTTAFTYEPVFNRPATFTDPSGHTSSLAYDANGNLLSVTDGNGNITHLAYTAGLLAQVTDPLGATITIGRDSLGNANSITDPNGNTTAITFDSLSRPVLRVDPLGRRSKTVYDVLNRVAALIDPKGNTTALAYDPAGNLLSVTDPRGNLTAYTYDSLSRLASRTSPLQKTESYQYDRNGNHIRHTDRRGQVSRFQYDALNRPIQEQYQDGSSVTRTYDPYGRPLTVTDSQSGLFTYAYDANGALLSQTEPNGAVFYTRDSLGRAATRRVAGQSTVTYSYDGAGNLLSSSMAAAGIAYSYDQRNLPATLSRSNGIATTLTFDPNTRIQSIVHARGTTPLNTQTYSYDPAGSRLAVTNDLAQPLLTPAAAAAAVDQANELLSNGQTTYTYDANGNRLTETGPAGTLTYAWDSRNRLSSLTDSSGNATAFLYDSRRNLIEVDKTAQGVTTRQKFVLDDLTNVVSITDSSGLPVSLLTGVAPDAHYASVDASGNVAFGIEDALGSIGGITNGSASLTSQAAYDPYGQSNSAPPSSFPFAFTGRVPVTGNILYFRARFLDTATGRFLSEDPAGFGGGDPNLYAYASRDPVDFTDPDGLDPNDYPTVPPLLRPLLDSDRLWRFMNTAGFRNSLDFSAGLENGLTLGLSDWAYRQLGLGDQFRECSGYFKAGSVAAFLFVVGDGIRTMANVWPKLVNLTEEGGVYFGPTGAVVPFEHIAEWAREATYTTAHLTVDITHALIELSEGKKQ